LTLLSRSICSGILEFMKKIILNKNERRALSALKDALMERVRLVDLRLFGSRARGDASPESDIDIMIEVEEYTPTVESLIDDTLFEINLSYDCFISAVIFSRKELEEGPLDASPLYKAVEKEGVRV